MQEVLFRMEPAPRAELKQLADALGVKVSVLVRHFVREGMAGGVAAARARLDAQGIGFRAVLGDAPEEFAPFGLQSLVFARDSEAA